jgi:UDP-N-acetylglucosamine 4,6-dehydratase/5-epimerase
MKNTSIIRNFAKPAPDLTGCSIMITGGTGSFGNAFVRKALTEFNPRKVIVFSRDELKQSEMARVFPSEKYPAIRFFIGDVRDERRLELAMRDVDYVIHAAALKQVPAAEYNPFECINTNVIGAENVVRASLRTNIKKVIALSTDKAANPINLYGASKLAGDKIFVAANNLSGTDGPRFSVVRYGNVLGSRGSVVELYQKLLRDGVSSIPITDPEMTRFWITIDQGVEFVLSSLAIMNGAETFIPKIPSMKITDVAEALAPGLPHEIVGIRAGEKLHELMFTADDARLVVEYEDRFVLESGFYSPHLAEEYLGPGVAAGDRYSYSSDTNTEWLDAHALQRLLGMQN